MIDPVKDEDGDFGEVNRGEDLGAYYQQRPSALDERFSRLHCRCLTTEYATKLEGLICHIEMLCDKDKYGNAIKSCQQTLHMLKELHTKEVNEYNYQYARSMIELSKIHVINPMQGPILQTSPWSVGAVDRLRNPPKKKSKKEQLTTKKRAKMQQANTTIQSKKLKK